MNLLALSAEVRRRIFEVYFEGRRLRWTAGSSGGGRIASNSVSLLFVCRQVYDESRSLMLATAQIDVTEMVDYEYSVLHPAVFDMSLLRHVYLSIDGPSKFADAEPKWNAHIFRRMPSLRTFTFSYLCSPYVYDTLSLIGEMSKADLDFIEQHPERILGDDYNMNSDGPMQNIELHSVEPFTDRLVTVWKQQQRSYRLVAEFPIVYEGVKRVFGERNFADLIDGVRALTPSPSASS